MIKNFIKIKTICFVNASVINQDKCSVSKHFVNFMKLFKLTETCSCKTSKNFKVFPRPLEDPLKIFLIL